MLGLALALPLLLAAPSEARAGVEISWVAGRAEVLGHGGRVGLDAAHPRHEQDGAGFLRVSAGSKVRLAFAGRGSLTVSGPARLDWNPASHGVAEIHLGVDFARRVDSETRQGRLSIELRQAAWTVSGGRGAFRFDGLSDGGVRLRHRAGVPLQVRSLASRSGTLPSLRLRPGARVLLEAP